MKPVDQTVFTVPGGNCFSACVASLLTLRITDVPYFMGYTEEEGRRWFERFEAWLRPRGFYPLMFKAAGWTPPAGALVIVGGKSPRGDFMHCCVGEGGAIVHDPHPSRAGLETIEDFTILIPFEPLS